MELQGKFRNYSLIPGGNTPSLNWAPIPKRKERMDPAVSLQQFLSHIPFINPSPRAS